MIFVVLLFQVWSFLSDGSETRKLGDETRGNSGTDGTLTSFDTPETGERPVCPRFSLSPVFPPVFRRLESSETWDIRL